MTPATINPVNINGNIIEVMFIGKIVQFQIHLQLKYVKHTIGKLSPVATYSNLYSYLIRLISTFDKRPLIRRLKPFH